MARIEKLNALTKQLKEWFNSLEYSGHRLEETLLQNDNADKFEEKIVSIGISALIAFLVVSIFALFGVPIIAGLIGSAVSFVIGLMLSKSINHKLFGNVRNIDQLTSEELNLIKASNSLYLTFKKLHTQIKVMVMAPSKQNSTFLFTSYPSDRARILRVQALIINHSPENLSFKYRKRYNSLTKKYALTLREFDRIYANT
jgi:hypothetical protein